MLFSFVFLLLSQTADGDSVPLPTACIGKSVCFEKGDRGLLFVLNPRSRSIEVVCHEGWDQVDADLACKEANFPRGALAVLKNLNSNGFDFFMDEVECNGTETNLVRCKHKERSDCGADQAAGAICDSATDDDLAEEETRLENCFASGVSFSPADEIGDSTIFSTSVQCQRHCASNPGCLQFSYSSIVKTCHLYSSASKVPNPFEVGGPPNCSSDALPEKLNEEICLNGTCLIGGSNEAEGNVFQEGRAVCDDSWGEEEARVVCRELGHKGGVLRYTTGSKFGPVPSPHSGGKHVCKGTEGSLLDCTFPSMSGMECDSGEGAGVVCDTRDPVVVAREQVCFNTGLAYHGTPPIASAHWLSQEGLQKAADCQEHCQVTKNCSHFTWFFSGGKCHLYTFSNILEDNKRDDEDAVSGPVNCASNMTIPAPAQNRSQYPSNPNSLTLLGNKATEGILHLNQKPICDDGWNIEAAHVACRQLGFSRAFQATQANQARSDEFSLDQVKCRGNETSLMECDHLDQSKEDCNSGEAAGVVCDARSERELRLEVKRRTEECFAKAVLFGPELTSDIWVLPTLLDCQDMCGNTQDCNTFSYDTSSKECRLHSVGEVEEAGYPQLSTTTPLPSVPTTLPYRAIQVGDRVRVCSNVDPPEYGWGSVSHQSIGAVVQVQPSAARSGDDKLKVDFKGHSGWNADRSEMEVVASSGEGRFKGSRCSGGSRPTSPRMRARSGGSSHVELKGGSGPHEGNVWVDGEPVCDDTFTESSHGEVNAQVICRMLGYGAGTFTRESQFGNVPGGDFGMDDVKCSGSETDIRDCRHETRDDCGAGEAAGVICSDFQGSDGESPSAAIECPSGWTQLSSGCYIFPIYQPPMTWGDGKVYCEAAGGAFVEVNSMTEQLTLTNHIKQWSSRRFWIGYNDLEMEGHWVWASGSEAEFTSWNSGMPDNRGEDTSNADCAYIDTNGLKWRDEGCDHSRIYGKNMFPICEFIPDPMKAVNKQFLNGNSTVISGPANCSFSHTETTCRGQTSSGQLCISGGGHQWEGNVFYEGKPLCDDLWGIEEAKLVCKEMGYGRAKNFTKESYFGSVKGPLSEVFCQRGSEHFSNCSVTSKQVCLGEEVAGVICETEDEKMRREEEEEMLNQCLVTGMEYQSKTEMGPAANPLQCQKFCEAEPDCSHFTFLRASSLCFIATGGGKQDREDAVSGPQSCDGVVSAISVTNPQCWEAGKVCLGSSTNPPSPGGPGIYKGNIFVGGKPICDDGWGLVNAEVVCRELQFFGVNMITKGSHFGYTSGHFSMDDLACHGNESKITHCPHSESENCYGGEAAGVVCDVRSKQVIEAEKRLIADCFVEDVIYWGTKIDATFPNVTTAKKCQEKCAQHEDCTHFTFWPTEIASSFQDCDQICLRGGSGPHEGNVIVHNQPVCDDDLAVGDSRALNVGHVACRQLGYLEAVSITRESHFGREGSTFSMDQVSCSGEEEQLLDCRYSSHDNCGDGEAFGVVCQGRPVVEGKEALLCELYTGSEQGVNKSLAGGAITGPKVCPSFLSSLSVCQGKPGVCLQEADGSLGTNAGNVFFNGTPVCDDGWDLLAANTVCRELNFTNGALKHTVRSHFGLVAMTFSLDEVRCFGNETELGNCLSSDVENCDGSEGAGVVCDTRREEEVNQEDQKLARECFSEAIYDEEPISFNKTSGPEKFYTYTANAKACQKVCASSMGCDLFMFSKTESRCSIFRLKSDRSRGGKRSRSTDFVTGPRECNTFAPLLVSYRGENCSASGVPCVTGGSGAWEGLAHIGGRPICQDNWGPAEATVFCRQLGFRDAVNYGSHITSTFGEARGPFLMNQLQCTGSEGSVSECTHEAPVTNCLQWEGARVECLQFQEEQVTTTEPSSSNCPGDCAEICLKGGSTCSEGNVFVRSRPVCDDSWGINDANVACRQLGYPGARNFTRENRFGSIHTSRFSMDDVGCQGDERSLRDCPHSSTDDCDSSEGAGVICLPPITTAAPPASTKSPLPCTITVYNGDWALSGLDEQFHPRNILYDACDQFTYHPLSANYWLAPAQTRASIILDLGCVQVIEGVTMKNTRNAHQNDRGLKQFIISISNSTRGPWRDVLKDQLEDVRNLSCNVPLVNFSLPDQLSAEERTASAVKLHVLSWYGKGAGLQYFEIHSQQTSGLGATLVLILLVVVLLALLGLAWKRRERMRRLLTNRDRYETIRKYMTQQSQQTLVDSPKDDDMADVDLEH